MSALGVKLQALLADQRSDAAAHARLLAESNRALSVGDLAASTLLADQAYEVLCRIRIRTQHMADLFDERDRFVRNFSSSEARV